jgi:hypothetical protein
LFPRFDGEGRISAGMGKNTANVLIEKHPVCFIMSKLSVLVGAKQEK